MKKRILSLAIIIYFSVMTTEVVLSAEAIKGNMVEEEMSHLVFVMDSSGSMSKYDGHKMIPRLLEVMTDTLKGEKLQIGYVVYNDTLLAVQPLTVIQQREDDIMEVLESTEYRGETDVGLGLYEAGRMLEGCKGKKRIILLSDGQTDLEHSSTGRTDRDSDRDIQQTLQKCQDKGIILSTILFGQETEGLKQMAESTGGRMYQVQQPEELVSILGELIYNELEYTIHETGTSIYDQGHQKISVENSGEYTQMTVLLISDKEIENADIFIEGQEDSSLFQESKEVVQLQSPEEVMQTEKSKEMMQLQESEKFLSVQNQKNTTVVRKQDGKEGLVSYHIPKDTEGRITIYFNTIRQQRVSVYLIGKQKLLPVINWMGELHKNQPVKFRISLVNQEGVSSSTANQRLQHLDWYAELRNSKTGEIRKIAIEKAVAQKAVTGESTTEKEAGGLLGTIQIGTTDNYELHLEGGKDGEIVYTVPNIQVKNRLPEGRVDEQLELFVHTQRQTVDLSQYFTDPDGDVLRFSLQEEGIGKIAAVEIDKSLLKINPISRGIGEIRLIVSDGEGELASSIPVRVRSRIELYWPIPVVFLGILLFVFWKIIRRRRFPKEIVSTLPKEMVEHSFTGKLNAYFTLLPQEEEIPPLSFALYPIQTGKIVLGNMFMEYPDLIKLLGLEEIYLFPGESRQLILYHESSATVMIGSSLVCQRIQYAVSYGNVIYITSREGDCELEVHYIASR